SPHAGSSSRSVSIPRSPLDPAGIQRRGWVLRTDGTLCKQYRAIGTDDLALAHTYWRSFQSARRRRLPHLSRFSTGGAASVFLGSPRLCRGLDFFRMTSLRASPARLGRYFRVR